MSKVCLVARIDAHEGQGDEIVKAFEPLFAQVENEPGTELYVLNRSTDDPDKFFLYELYTDQAALDAHGSSDTMRAALAVLGPCIKDRARFVGTTARAFGLPA